MPLIPLYAVIALAATIAIAGATGVQAQSAAPAPNGPHGDRTEKRSPGTPPGPLKLDTKPGKPPSPLDLLMKDGIPEHAEKRAALRDDLYALLSTAAGDKEAKKIAASIERIWRTSGSDTVSVLMRRASTALKSKKEDLALSLLDNVVDLAPDYAEAWNRRAFAHYSAKNYRAAVGDLRRALALDKNHFKALDGLATIFQQLGDDAKALAVYEQLRQIHPHFPGLDKSYDTLKRKVEGRGI